jgi:hypothetical protein
MMGNYHVRFLGGKGVVTPLTYPVGGGHRMRKKIQIPAMRERDLRALLQRHGISEAVDQGECECVHCGLPITWDNIGGVVMKSGRPVLVCCAPDCIERAGRGASDG